MVHKCLQEHPVSSRVRMSSMSQECISQVLKNIIKFILDPTVEAVPTKIKENCGEVSPEIEAEDELGTSLF